MTLALYSAGYWARRARVYAEAVRDRRLIREPADPITEVITGRAFIDIEGGAAVGVAAEMAIACAEHVRDDARGVP